MDAMTVGAVGGAGATAGVGAAGGMDFQGVASQLGVSAGALQNAVQNAEAKGITNAQDLAADVQKQLGLTNLSNDQKMALTGLCQNCLNNIGNKALQQNGLQSDTPLFGPNSLTANAA